MIEAKQMWEGGPLRQMSTVKESLYFIPYANAKIQGFAGHYICGQCQVPSASGVRLICNGLVRGWLCQYCIEGKPSRAAAREALIARMAMAREAKHHL